MSLMLGLAATAMAVAPPLPAALCAAAARYDKAQVDGDGPALRRLLADDYLLANSGGMVEDKPEFIRDLTAAGYKLEPFRIMKPVTRVWTGGAVLGGIVRLRGREDGTAFDACLRFADVWSLRRGEWKVAYSQAARLKDAACAG